MDRTHGLFCVFEFGDDLAAVTAVMGIAPSQAWLKGDPLPHRASARRTHSRWALQSGLGEDEDVDAHLAALLALLEPRAAAVREVASRYEAVLRFALYFESVNPGIHLPEGLVARVAALGLALDFDLYCLGEPEGEAVSPAG